MTRFEEEIADVIISCIARGTVENGDVAKAAAEVAKKYIEKAYHDSLLHFFNGEDEYKTVSTRREAWMKENGIVE